MALNITTLITDTDPRLHSEAMGTWLGNNSPVIGDFLAERYDAIVTTDEG